MVFLAFFNQPLFQNWYGFVILALGVEFHVGGWVAWRQTESAIICQMDDNLHAWRTRKYGVVSFAFQ